MSRSLRRRSVLAAVCLVATSACASRAPVAGGPAARDPAPEPSATPPPGLPPVPSVDGPLAIQIVHPPPNLIMRPNVNSVFVFGSVGTGSAMVTVNGLPVSVAPNGAFLGFLPRPPDDTLRVVARSGNQVAEADTWYRAPSTDQPTPAVETLEYTTPRAAQVTNGGDTLATGSDVAIGRPTPGGTYRWFLPRGARLTVTGERGNSIRALLDAETVAWFPRSELSFGSALPGPAGGAPTLRPGEGWTDVRLPVGGAPFRVAAADSLLEVTLHGVTPGFTRLEANDAVVKLVEVVPSSDRVGTVRIYPDRWIWGFKAFYELDGTLVVRVRRPPSIDPSNPLAGIRIVVDPGHPPAGAVGPTGLVEADANLGIGLRLAEQLRSRGAEVLVTRATRDELSLGARVETAVGWNADILISIHNNAFAEGANPFLRNGTSTYYFHPFAAGLAQALNDEIKATTLIQDLGVIWGNLALARPSWMPAVLTESLFMSIPEQEAALRNPIFLEQLAAAHLRGIERFLRLRGDF